MCLFKKIDELINAFKDLKSIFLPKNLKIIPNSFRFILGVCLNKYGIKFKMKKIPRGLYKKPFTIEFSEMLMDYSNGEFHTIGGKHINNWTDTDVKDDLESICLHETFSILSTEGTALFYTKSLYCLDRAC